MVVVLNGVLADECPTSVRALLASHPGYRDAAAQLLAAAARVVPPPGLLYVDQRELAVAVPHESEYCPLTISSKSKTIAVGEAKHECSDISLLRADGEPPAPHCLALDLALALSGLRTEPKCIWMQDSTFGI